MPSPGGTVPPVGPCERYGELRRENVVLQVPLRQPREVAGVASVGCRGRFGRRIDEDFAAGQFAP